MSTTLVKVQHKGAVTIPTHLRTQAGIVEGDMMEASFHQGKIILIPKVVIDRSSFPTADADYTPAQRRVIDARLAKAEEDIKKGRTHGPFKTAAEASSFVSKEIKTRKAARKRKTTKA
jgi:AbrB family looped-hinge helix DNA binding protein